MLGVSGIFSDLEVEVELDAPIGSMTWYGVGGRADVLLRPRTIEALSTLVKRCRRSQTPLRILGRGANLLVADEGVDGVVVKLDHDLFRTTEYEERHGDVFLKAMAGADTAKTIMDCARRGLEGLSQMAGIPSSIGGAVRMNAGGAYGCIGDSVYTVLCMKKSGTLITYREDDLVFDYRSTNIPDPIILGATFRLHQTDPIALRKRVMEIFEYKKSTQPLAEHSAGCAFRNPFDPEIEERVSAGRLIDEADLKGERIGGAVVSPRHANFITVEAGATATDVMRLIDLIRSRVFDNSGIELETEVVIWKRGNEGEL